VVRTCSGRGTTDEENQSSEDEEESIDQEALDNLVSLTNPFFEGQQFPPPPHFTPPPEVELPPLPSSASSFSTASEMSDHKQNEGGLPPPPLPLPPVEPHAPTPKEKGKQPDPFTKLSEYENFHRQLSLYFRINGRVYPTDLEKIYFTLSLMMGGSPGQWAMNFLEKMDKRAVNGDIPDTAWGTFEEFVSALKDSFEDPNKGKTAYNQLETFKYAFGRRADEFFQEFETLAGRAGYIAPKPNNAYLIDLIEQKVPKPLLIKVYNDKVPTTYVDYKEKIIRFDNLN